MKMDKILNKISDLNQYTFATRDPGPQKGHLSLATVLALKKIRTLEIQYFHKYEDNGIAVAVFQDLLNCPPSKTWGLLGKELIFILKFWLDALQKQLFPNATKWWAFVKTLLLITKTLRQKHNSFPNMLVHETAETLLELASNPKVDIIQQNEIINCFNLCSAETSREIRVVMKTKIDKYLLNLSTIMANCGHFPTQLSILEALLRWTIGRQDINVRKKAAQMYLPANLYNKKAFDLFLERKWNDFAQDARDFFNIHNSEELVSSVPYKELIIGNMIIINGTENKEFWLDINSTTKCITLLLDPLYIPDFNPTSRSCYEMLTINKSDVTDVQLKRISEDAVLTVNISEPIELFPSMMKFNQKTVILKFSTRDNFDKVNRALYSMFGDEKYKLLPPENLKTKNDDFAHLLQAQTRRRAGYMVRPRYDPLRSPSTASTSSLAQLPQKLAALPRYRYEKEPVSVCAQPELSNVTEVTEPASRSSLNTTSNTFKLGHCGVFSKKNKDNIENERLSQSDSELKKPNKAKGVCISPVVHDENSISLLLVATIGSDESVINDTIKRLPKEKACTTDNIIELLAQEALQAKAKPKNAFDDSGINTAAEKTHETHEVNSDIVENTPYFEIVPKTSTSAPIKCNDKDDNKTSSSNESNTEELIEATDIPVSYVSTRTKKMHRNSIDIEQNVFDCQMVDNFFSQHFSENPAGELIISPTLARKINESSSSESEFNENILQMNDNDAEIEPCYDEDVLQCLQNLIDKVCEAEQKSVKVNKNQHKSSIIGEENKKDIIERDVAKKMQNDNVQAIESVKRKPPTKSIKLNYVIAPKAERTAKTRSKNKKTKPKVVNQTKMSTIKEADEIIHHPESPLKENAEKTSPDSDTLLIRRKRKLYSPKDDNVEMSTKVKQPKIIIPETCEEIDSIVPDSNVSKKETTKPLATPYKEIEKERKRIRKSRQRRSKSTPISPRSVKRNEMFDQLKMNIENTESITMVDKNKEAIYNFTSDSEDEDFKKKTIEIQKRVSATTISSFGSTKSTKRGRKVTNIDYSENKSDTAETNPVQKPRRKRSKRQNPKEKKKTKVVQSITKSLVDEKMRSAPETLNTSIVENLVEENTVKDPEPNINIVHETEIIEDNENIANYNSNTKKSQRILKVKKEIAEINRNKEVTPKSTKGSESPLPGLVVEKVPENINLADDRSITPNLIKKFKLYKDGQAKENNITNTTQNLLSDAEIINYSTEINITEEVNRGFDDIMIEDLTNFTADSNKENILNKHRKKRTKNLNLRKNKNQPQTEVNKPVEPINLIYDDDLKSIETDGRSPITAHGDSNEQPPSPELLNKTVIPRNLEVEDLDASTAKYFMKLTREANKSNDNSCNDHTSNTTIQNPARNSSDVTDNSINKSPVVKLIRLPSGDIHNWLPSPRSSDDDDFEVIQIQKTKEKHDLVKRKNKEDKDKSSNSSSVVKANTLKNNKNQKNAKKSKADNISIIQGISIQENEFNQYINTANNSSPILQKTNRQSMISPIKLTFDDVPALDNLSNTSKSDNPVKTPNTYESTGYFLRNTKLHEKIKKSPVRKPIKEADDKVFAIENEDLCASGRSVSSVNEWFKNIEYPNLEEPVTSHNNEVIETVMEKLDTTLAQIHESTSKKFIGLFINTQQQLQLQRNKRHQMYKEMMKDLTQIIDSSLANFEKKIRETEVQFMENLKKESCNLVREDNKQKRAMVVLLKEDMQSVADHIAKQKRPD